MTPCKAGVEEAIAAIAACHELVELATREFTSESLAYVDVAAESAAKVTPWLCKVSPCAAMSAKRDEVALSRTVLDISPVAELRDEPSVKVKPPLPSAKERICACPVTASDGVQIDEVAMKEGAITLWYNDRKPVGWSRAGLGIPATEGSIPSTGCRISTRSPEVLDEKRQFAIMDDIPSPALEVFEPPVPTM